MTIDHLPYIHVKTMVFGYRIQYDGLIKYPNSGEYEKDKLNTNDRNNDFLTMKLVHISVAVRYRNRHVTWKFTK